MRKRNIQRIRRKAVRICNISPPEGAPSLRLNLKIVQIPPKFYRIESAFQPAHKCPQRERQTPWLPLWGSCRRRKAVTERVIRCLFALSVSPMGCHLSQRERQVLSIPIDCTDSPQHCTNSDCLYRASTQRMPRPARGNRIFVFKLACAVLKAGMAIINNGESILFGLPGRNATLLGSVTIHFMAQVSKIWQNIQQTPVKTSKSAN